MKYKVGDKVRVKKDLKIGEMYGNDYFSGKMKNYSGKTMTVGIVANTDGYRLKEDTYNYNWTDEMLEDVEDITILVKGNKVIAKKGDKVGIAKRSPEDEFDIFTRVRFAIDRLEEECKSYGWLKKDVTYYFPRVDTNKLYDYYQCNDDDIDKRFISRGIVFKTKEEAISCAKKMLKVVK